MAPSQSISLDDEDWPLTACDWASDESDTVAGVIAVARSVTADTVAGVPQPDARPATRAALKYAPSMRPRGATARLGFGIAPRTPA